ncbi:hypothetical protein ACP70R_045991 [Stipagrostis hirtigluma subsp. patula]
MATNCDVKRRMSPHFLSSTSRSSILSPPAAVLKIRSAKLSPRYISASSALAQSITVEALAHDDVEDAMNTAADELAIASRRLVSFLRFPLLPLSLQSRRPHCPR